MVRVVLLAFLLVGALPAAALGQSSAAETGCSKADRASVTRPGWFVATNGQLERMFPPDAQSDVERVPPLWTSHEGPISFQELAKRAAPILIFSPLEFLRSENPRAGIHIPNTIGDRTPSDDAEPVVYYRVREVWLERDAWTGDWERNVQEPIVRSVTAYWSCDGGGARAIGELDYVVLRYFFYYPGDRGLGGHEDDLESVEMRIRRRQFCPADPSLECFQALTLSSVAGSAHGIGWSTNVLQVDDTRDTRLPITILVEKDKHAMSPDRDGNGIYRPHYDTNRYTKDAWGVRDQLASGWLGGASFSSDFEDERAAADRLFPRDPAPALRALYEARGSGKWGHQSYKLEFSEGTAVCQRIRGEKEKEGEKKEEPSAELRSLIDGKNFCGTPATVVKRATRFERTVGVIGNLVSQGPSSRYGFMHYAQRLSFAGRFDGGWGVTGVLPIGFEVPAFGGWIVSRFSVIPNEGWSRLPEKVKSHASEILYAPSGSRTNDWYLSAGIESSRSGDGGALERHAAGEAGVKFRFNIEKLRKWLQFSFVGVRLGFRTSSFSGPVKADGAIPRLWRTRLVAEVGAGSW